MLWVKVSGYPKYLISENGQVYSIKKALILKGERDKDGYIKYRLYTEGRSKKIFAHRLVAMHFLEGFKSSLVVNHKDCVKTNNHYTNLEICTVAHNNLHARRNISFNYQKGSSHYASKLDEETVWKILDDPCSLVDAEKKYRYDRRNIFRIRKGKIWKSVHEKYIREKRALPRYEGSRSP